MKTKAGLSALLMLLVAVGSAGVVSAGHAKTHDNTCVGEGGNDRTKRSGDDYERRVVQTCVISVEPEGSVCFQKRDEGHYWTGDADSEDPERQRSGSEKKESATLCLLGGPTDRVMVLNQLGEMLAP